MAAQNQQFNVIIVGAGLSGMVAAYEAARSGLRVLVLDQENRKNLGGQAFWSLGGLFFVNSPEQRLMGVKDSEELAWRDWQNSAQWDDAAHDYWPRQWGREYVRFATHEKRDYLRALGLRSLPTVGWAERGSGDGAGHGNSVPRFHVTWGTGPEVVRIFQEPLEEFERQGKVEFRFRHQVDELITEDTAQGTKVVGVRGSLLAEDDSDRGVKSSREVVGQFEERATATVVTSGGIGGNLDLVRRSWPTERWGEMPDNIVVGVPAHVDGRMIDISHKAGANLVNTDRMWHYTEGMMNWDPIWPKHGIRIIPGPSSLWLDATGKRFPTNIIPGGDTIATMEEIGKSGHGYSWFILTKAIADKEFIFSGSEQNDDITIKTVKNLVQKVTSKETHYAVKNFMDHGEDWILADNLSDLVTRMNELVGPDNPQIDEDDLRRTIEHRDSQVDNKYSKDAQINYIRMARGYLGDRIVRCEAPHKLLDESKGPLIAIRIRLLTRKTLGGIETDLSGRCLTSDGEVLPGLYAAGEVAGFGGGGVHGKNALEGTFLGGCIHSGKRVGEALRSQVEALDADAQ
ncbi:FAD-binding dehydrogenase [Corynebacterium sp. 319]|uniref:FAD-binding dehydrogenase n=1 Tax=unclassified Corynebacterium TaxID=2624378 RepID=UPI00125CB971|nr:MULTISPECIES: FAD-binding dehydrogenase [unclassified Corynebacterium]KAB1553493.1 FAD-binding dehydrogenase [Corynebacterium sp. 319]KAB3540763.1 FAD-binding dehydrogenase [Corynebacterium sp. 366]